MAVRRSRDIGRRGGLAALAVAAVLFDSGCGGVDPYEAFLKNGGGDTWLEENGEPMISREDAQLRARLVADVENAPQTIDWYLQEAYG